MPVGAYPRKYPVKVRGFTKKGGVRVGPYIKRGAARPQKAFQERALRAAAAERRRITEKIEEKVISQVTVSFSASPHDLREMVDELREVCFWLAGFRSAKEFTQAPQYGWVLKVLKNLEKVERVA